MEKREIKAFLKLVQSGTSDEIIFGQYPDKELFNYLKNIGAITVKYCEFPQGKILAIMKGPNFFKYLED